MCAQAHTHTYTHTLAHTLSHAHTHTPAGHTPAADHIARRQQRAVASDGKRGTHLALQAAGGWKICVVHVLCVRTVMLYIYKL